MPPFPGYTVTSIVPQRPVFVFSQVMMDNDLQFRVQLRQETIYYGVPNEYHGCRICAEQMLGNSFAFLPYDSVMEVIDWVAFRDGLDRAGYAHVFL